MATATTTPMMTAVSTPPEPGRGGTAGESGRGRRKEGGGELMMDGVNQHLVVPLTRYTETASECLAFPNIVPCHHTDSVRHSIH